MVNYQSILTEDLAKRPVPAALKKCCTPFIVPVYLENTSCKILKQTWEGYAEGMYIQFTGFEIIKKTSIMAAPSIGGLTSLIYIQKGCLSVREHFGGESLPRPEASLLIRKVNSTATCFILDFPEPGFYGIVYVSLSDSFFKKMVQGYPSLMKNEILDGRPTYKAGARVKWLIEEMGSRKFKNIALQATYFERRAQRLYEAFLDLSCAHCIDWQGMEPAFRMMVLKDYMDNNLGNDLTLSTLSGMLGMTGIGLRKAFKKKFGIAISIYVMGARIKESCKLLASSNSMPTKSILSIAHGVGYNSLQGFGKAFRAVLQTTPEKYRKTHLKT